MTEPVINDPDLRIYQGDARAVLPLLPPDSIDCAITSPPFYGLRDYGVEGQIGLETTADLWAEELCAVFRALHPVLRTHGTLWVEVGDSYNEKELVGSPWLFAQRMKQDGWLLRQCIIWHKPNAMPESATDRCTMAHSYIFLFAKQQSYYFDAVAIAEPAKWERWGDQTTPKYNGTKTQSGWMEGKVKEELPRNPTKNPRSVWTIPTGGFQDAHFATFPEFLVSRMLRAGCPRQVCVTCHTPRERVMGDSEGLARWEGQPQRTGRPDGAERRNPRGGKKEWETYVPAETVSWTICACGTDFVPGTVLDPFMGSGTTAVVARRLGLHSVGVELNSEYIDMIRTRTQQLSLLA